MSFYFINKNLYSIYERKKTVGKTGNPTQIEWYGVIRGSQLVGVSIEYAKIWETKKQVITQW